MCIAILKPEGIELYKQTLENCWYANSDGAGFMYAEGGKLHIKKGFFTFKDFLDAYEPHSKKKCVLHFRIRTHGDINVDNCHPYQVDDNLAFVHNGTIMDTQGDDKSFSDTWYFNRDFLQPIRQQDRSFFKKHSYQKLIEKYIGWSKLIFLNSKGEHQIMNESAGNWDSQCWFSNTSWKRTTTPINTPTQRKYWGDDDDVIMPPKKTNNTRSIIPIHSKGLESGDICWIKHETMGFKFGTYVAVKYVYTDQTIGVYDPQNPKREGRIHVSCLEKSSIKNHKVTLPEKETPNIQIGDIVMFKRNFNHFRIADDVTVKDVNHITGMCTILDDHNDKEYRVPMSYVEPFPFEGIYIN